jgi:site-specific recombinase XerC
LVQPGIPRSRPERLLGVFWAAHLYHAGSKAGSQSGGSLRDVQLLAGHASIVTTQCYIDGDTDAQRRLVSLI